MGIKPNMRELVQWADRQQHERMERNSTSALDELADQSVVETLPEIQIERGKQAERAEKQRKRR